MLPGFTKDLKMEAMLPVLDGKVSGGDFRQPGALHSRRDRVRGQTACQDRDHASRTRWESGPDLKSNNIPVILGRTEALPENEDDAYEEAMTLPAEFYKAGVKFAFGTFSNEFLATCRFKPREPWRSVCRTTRR